MAPDAPPRAAPRDHLSVVRRAATADGRHRRRCARSAARVETIPRSDPAKGHAALLRGRGAHLVDPLPYAVGEVPIARRIAARLDALLAGGVRPDRLRLPGAGGEPAARAAVPGGALHAQRRSRDLAAARREREQPRSRGCCTARSTGGCCASRRGRCARFDGVLAVSDADRADVRAALSRRDRAAGPRRPDRRRHRYFAPTPSSPVVRAHARLHRLDGLAAERGRDALLLPRDPAAHPRRASPTSTLSIVGRAPTPAVQRLASEHGVDVTGRVDDVRPYMRDAAVYIVPLRIGGGTRLKIFEAMAMGKAVVSTTVGAEGLPVTDGEHLLLADDPRDVRARGRAPAARRRAPRRARSGRPRAGRRALRLVGRGGELETH